MLQLFAAQAAAPSIWETIGNAVSAANQVVNDVVWGLPMLLLLVGTGIFLTIRSGFFQVGHFGYTMKNTLLAIFRDKNVAKTKDRKAISQFQAAATALAATVGTGNIVGVATAIAAGGPGAVFWMWISAFFGMMTSFSENVLGVFYRRKNKNGEWSGGPMIYLERGLGLKWLAVLFSIFCLVASFGIGNIAQVNGIASSLQNTFSIPTWVSGLALALIVAVVVLGDLKRLVSVTEKLVPFMAVFYILGALIIIFMNVTHIPAAFGEIFQSAFNFTAVGSGIMGYGISRAIRYGFSRGVFSNEAGLGSSVIVHSSSDVKEPVVQGMWGIFQVFLDTIVICTLTALVILTSGAHQVEGLKGVAVTSYAFGQSLGVVGEYIVTFSILLFAFSTILGWSVYGTRAVEYLIGERAVPIYKIFFILVSFVGSVSSVQLVWDLSDTFNGLMAIPNLIGLLALSGTVVQITRNYKDRAFRHKAVAPLLSADAQPGFLREKKRK